MQKLTYTTQVISKHKDELMAVFEETSPTEFPPKTKLLQLASKFYHPTLFRIRYVKNQPRTRPQEEQPDAQQ